MIKKQITINMSAFAPPIEEQFTAQGVKHEQAERFEKERKALTQLYFADAVTDAELAKIEKRLFKRFTTGLKLLEGENQ